MPRCRCINCLVPPHILNKLLESKNKEVRQSALQTMLLSARIRGERNVQQSITGLGASGNSRRTVFDCENTTNLTAARTARSEDGAASTDGSVNQAFDGLGITRDFFKKVLNRNSIDDRGMRLNGYVHYSETFNNAFWDGQRMVFGDGDGVLFSDFTGSLDVIGHELAHGVTEHAAGLIYHNQSGALNESMSDVFGSLVKQWHAGQTAADADWLIGNDIFTPNVDADALRSMKAPGTAFDNPDFGRDPQPDHMRKFVHLPDTDDGDFGGVHINSGIPNKAFYLTAIHIGGYAWDAPGHIWYESLKASNPNTQFQDFAQTTYAKAEELYGAHSDEQKAVVESWREVGIRVGGRVLRPRKGNVKELRVVEDDNLGALIEQLDAVFTRMKTLLQEDKARKAS
jgi:Zn-dependent metalloprotease